MSILAVLFVLLSSLAALALPWLGAMMYYLFSVAQMQDLFPEDFGKGRVQIIIALSTFVGVVVATALQKVDWSRLLTPYSLLMLLFTILINVSVSLSTFSAYIDPIADPTVIRRSLSQEQFMDVFNRTILFWFIASVLIDTRKKLLCCVYLLAFILVYYTMWANKAYFSGAYWLFGLNGRLGGPINSVYRDENYLAMLFVMATPVLYYIGISCRVWFFRYAIWMLIPLTWHALFLTSSRGGMLALGAVILYVCARSFNRVNSIAIVTALVFALIFQSGQFLNRVDKTFEESEEILVPEEQVIDPRLLSWTVATEIIRDFPVLGVGPANFYHAYGDYRNTKPYVVHNTFLQIAANCGVLAGLIYLWFFWQRLPTLARSATINGQEGFPRGFKRDYLDDLLNSLMLGFFIVAIFLDLMIYEILYFIILMSYSKYVLDRTPEPKKLQPLDSIYKRSKANPSPKRSSTEPRTRSLHR